MTTMAGELIPDDGEQVALMEPMRPSEQNPGSGALADLAFEVVARSKALGNRAAPAAAAGLKPLLRTVNAYYSNLIEGHDLHPIEAERAIKGTEAPKPNQLEAAAHIRVQEWIDSGHTTALGLVELARRIHRDFYTGLPDDLRVIAAPDGTLVERITPGEWRKGFVSVGRHVPISPGAIPRFMSRWEEAYPRPRTDLMAALPAMHHRFAWIHPYPDLNGRIARLITHAMMTEISAPLWSISRALGRDTDRYLAMMTAADAKRRGELDGRGSRSEGALLEFSIWFLESCRAEISFMEQLLDPDRLTMRVLQHLRALIARGALHPDTEKLVRALFRSGTVARAEIATILDSDGDIAGRILKDMVRHEIATAGAPITLSFAATHAEHWLPGLLPPASR